jgi:hypothetical protein
MYGEQTMKYENCQLEYDLDRGVLYIHHQTTGTTVLRICGLPKQLPLAPIFAIPPLLDINLQQPDLSPHTFSWGPPPESQTEPYWTEETVRAQLPPVLVNDYFRPVSGQLSPSHNNAYALVHLYYEEDGDTVELHFPWDEIVKSLNTGRPLNFPPTAPAE